MKTTIDIADGLLAQAKRRAEERGTTLREVVEDALRQALSSPAPATPFRLRDAAVEGQGLQPGMTWGDWETWRRLAYEGRGG